LIVTIDVCRNDDWHFQPPLPPPPPSPPPEVVCSGKASQTIGQTTVQKGSIKRVDPTTGAGVLVPWPGPPDASGSATRGRHNCSVMGGWDAFVVGYQDSGFFTPYHAVRTTLSGDFIDLGTLGGDSSFATDVSCDGSVVVGFSDLADSSFNQHAFRWTPT